ncbi:RHS repeat-associated core domain-containing protein [Vibrio harveyi]|uniref:RHS repeat-associated core domain-containing protein n=1 Tax=Vibrio harveyi TaxID=669 RepID=UPI000680D76E|nr:RHS repeat-associated core domain-containing protein [Vibrio harveyi]
MKDKNKALCPKSVSRRTLLKGTVGVGAASILPSHSMALELAMMSSRTPMNLSERNIGFQGMLCASSSSLMFAGNGLRSYSPKLGRFLELDKHNMSPFGKGGVNGYTFVELDPVNLRDPSGQFAILSFVIGAIFGAIAGASISAISEGVRSAVAGDSFDWKRVVSGAVIGGISGGLGAASVGATKSVKAGLSIADIVISGSVEFGIDMGSGASAGQAGVSAGMGMMVGFITLGIGSATGGFVSNVRKGGRRLINAKQSGMGGHGSKSAGRRWANEAFNNPGEGYQGLSMLEVLTGQTEIADSLARSMSDRSVGRLRAASKTINSNLDRIYKKRLIDQVEEATSEITRLSTEHARAANLFSRRIYARDNWLRMNDIYVERAALLRTRDRALRTLKDNYKDDYQLLMFKYPFMLPRR